MYLCVHGKRTARELQQGTHIRITLTSSRPSRRLVIALTAPRLFQVARECKKERETTERGSWRPGQNGTRDKRIRTEIRERGREIGSVSERKSAKGKNEGTRRRRLYRGTKSQKKMHRKHEGTRRRKVAEGNEQEPLIQREIRERREETVKTVESNKYLDWKGERGD